MCIACEMAFWTTMAEPSLAITNSQSQSQTNFACDVPAEKASKRPKAKSLQSKRSYLVASSKREREP